MSVKLSLFDMADDLMVLNRKTVETLFASANAADCFALYGFYYKTAKWQKTNRIKANDTYVRKCLKWGKLKVTNTKTTLKKLGLINIIQNRKGNKIDGWFIEISYMVTTEQLKVTVLNDGEVNTNNHRKQQPLKRTSTKQDTSALKITNKCLKNNNINALKENKQKNIHKQLDLSALPKDISTDVIKEFIDYRIKIKKSLTQNSLNRAVTQIIKTATELKIKCNLVITETIDAGWQGIGKSDWLKNRLNIGANNATGKRNNNRETPAQELERIYAIKHRQYHQENGQQSIGLCMGQNGRDLQQPMDQSKRT